MRIESFRLYENLCGGKLGGAKGARAPAENVGKKVTPYLTLEWETDVRALRTYLCGRRPAF